MNLHSSIILFCLFLLLSCQSTEQKNSKNHSIVNPERIDFALKSLVDDNSLVGVSALVYEANKEVYFGAYGMANREKGFPMQRDTLFQMYSMTKPITGTVLMTLYDEGKFKLDDPLKMYAPEFADLKVFKELDKEGNPRYEVLDRDITVRDLMRHTAGFSQWGADHEEPTIKTLWQQLDPMNRNNTQAEMASKIAQVPLLFQPGTRWYYGPSVDIQAFLAERIAGKPYLTLLQERVLTPLKMQNTSYYLSESKRNKLSAVYQRADDGSMTADAEKTYDTFFQHWPLNPGGNLIVTTIDDYMRFARMLQNGGELDGTRVLEKETVRLMATDAMPSNITDKSWLPSKGQVGFGINLAVRTAPPASPNEAAGVVGEFFWDGWSNTLFFIDPKYKITAVLFNHYYPFGNVPIQKNFRDAVYFSTSEAHMK